MMGGVFDIHNFAEKFVSVRGIIGRGCLAKDDSQAFAATELKDSSSVVIRDGHHEEIVRGYPNGIDMPCVPSKNVDAPSIEHAPNPAVSNIIRYGTWL